MATEAAAPRPDLAPGARVWVEGKLPGRVLEVVGLGLVRVATHSEVVLLPACLLEGLPR